MNYTELFQFTGARVLVIGAGSGIGRESALALAAHGATVVCADRDESAAADTAEKVGGGATALKLDVLDAEAVQTAAAEYSDIAALVFTAATNVRKRIVDYTPSDFDRVVDLNLRAAFSLVQAFAPKMAANGGGSIVGFSSIRAFTVEPGQGVYAATKAALVQLARTAAAEFGPDGVRVNVIAPGVVETPLTAQIKNSPDWYNAYANKGALKRWAKPEELAGAVVYLSSQASTYVTGSVLMVDGGWTAVDGRFDPPNS
jgi:NAD(P)-dependent dehydrogenase (short-subunit alcohol dehydrogenase family)